MKSGLSGVTGVKIRRYLPQAAKGKALTCTEWRDPNNWADRVVDGFVSLRYTGQAE